MRYPVIPLILTAIFIVYVLYMALIKRNIKAKFQTVVMPGLFFIVIWVAIYFLVK